MKNSLNNMVYFMDAQSDMMEVSPSDVLTPNEQHPVVTSNKWLTTELQWLQKQYCLQKSSPRMVRVHSGTIKAQSKASVQTQPQLKLISGLKSLIVWQDLR